MLHSCSLNAIYPVPVLKVQTFKCGIHSESLALIVYAAFPRLHQIPRKSPVIFVNDNGYFRNVHKNRSESTQRQFQPPIAASFNLFPLIWVKAITFYDLRYAYRDSGFYTCTGLSVLCMCFSNIFSNSLRGFTIPHRTETLTIKSEKEEGEGRSKIVT